MLVLWKSCRNQIPLDSRYIYLLMYLCLKNRAWKPRLCISEAKSYCWHSYLCLFSYAIWKMKPGLSLYALVLLTHFLSIFQVSHMKSPKGKRTVRGHSACKFCCCQIMCSLSLWNLTFHGLTVLPFTSPTQESECRGQTWQWRENTQK